MQKALIIGVGPNRGLGAQLCKRFAKDGLHVVAAGRALTSLDAVVADIQGAGRRPRSSRANDHSP
jgi:NAD(P)-dependent dehydrogenase (short-subunit alcohol dehydrogenase family)